MAWYGAKVYDEAMATRIKEYGSVQNQERRRNDEEWPANMTRLLAACISGDGEQARRLLDLTKTSPFPRTYDIRADSGADHCLLWRKPCSWQRRGWLQRPRRLQHPCVCPKERTAAEAAEAAEALRLANERMAADAPRLERADAVARELLAEEAASQEAVRSKALHKKMKNKKRKGKATVVQGQAQVAEPGTAGAGEADAEVGTAEGEADRHEQQRTAWDAAAVMAWEADRHEQQRTAWDAAAALAWEADRNEQQRTAGGAAEYERAAQEAERRRVTQAAAARGAAAAAAAEAVAAVASASGGASTSGVAVPSLCVLPQASAFAAEVTAVQLAELQAMAKQRAGEAVAGTRAQMAVQQQASEAMAALQAQMAGLHAWAEQQAASASQAMEALQAQAG
ncbi:hypothetical protein FOA52_001317 [Chlamydomonas sp. UWO 241]|nr:hypothetical protein FOA52_001317 [Chlamydomonas sp. UWO 241]